VWLVAHGLCMHGSRMSISQNKEAKSIHGNIDEQNPRRRLEAVWKLGLTSTARSSAPII
jgi:hypothetical protein